MWIQILKDNFPLIFETFRKSPFVILTIIFILCSGVMTKKYFNLKENYGDLKVESSIQKDSMNNQIIIMEKQLKDCKKYDNYQAITDSVMLSLFRNNLLNLK